MPEWTVPKAEMVASMYVPVVVNLARISFTGGEIIACMVGALMLDGLFQPMHWLVLVVLLVGVFLAFRVHWRLGSKLK
jgi:hypothetical protein